MNMSKPAMRLVKARALATTSAIALVASAFAGPQLAHAQTPAPQDAQATGVEEIVVTGSRIVRDGYEAPTPVSVLGAEQLDAMANTNIADAVNTLPAFSNSVTPRTLTGNLSGGASGVNQLNLRGLGAGRTLVLLDGQRVINSSINSTNSAPDINSFPNGLISRVDVVTGGASAAYGSDALAGVVNFVLDHEFTGVKGKVEGGVTTYGDDRAYTVSLSAGSAFGGGRGHILAFGEIAYNDGIRGNYRPWNANSASVIENPAWNATNGLPRYLVGRQVGLSNGTPGGLITSGPLKGITFGPGGIPTMFNYGLVSTNNVMLGGDWQTSRIDNGLDLDPRLVRQSVYGRVSYDVTDDVQVFAVLQWAFAHATTNSNPNRRLANNTIQSGNPFIPASVQAQMTALNLTSFVMGTTNADIPRFLADNSRNLRRGVVGANGKFEAFGSDWKWDSYYQLSTTGLSIRTANNGITPYYNNAIDAVRAPNGSIVCRSTLTNPANGCVPYNVFGIGVNSQAAVNYVAGTGYRYDALRQDVMAVSANGEPFSSWAGPVSVAFGAEHRYERITGVATALDELTSFFAGNYHASKGHYDVNEGFVETVVPLAKDTEWAKSLDLNAAVRATSYSTSGYVTTWKIGGTYQPIDDLRFRATRSRDIRAPNLGELFSAGQTGSGTPIKDPFTNTTTTNSFALSSGNPLLKPETADTTGFGVVLSPSFFPGFQASVDYYNIDIAGAVKVPTAQSVVDLCFAGNTALCNLITRSNNVIIQVVTSPANIQSQNARGLDLEASYRVQLDEINNDWGGSLTVRALGTYVDSLKTIDSTNGTVEGAGVLGSFASNISSGLTSPKFRSNVSLAYNDNPVGVTFIWHHTGGGVYNNAFTSCTSGCPTGAIAGQYSIDNNHIEGNNTYDLALNYKPFENNPGTEVFFTVQNLFNQAPPIIGGNTGSTYYNGQGNTDYDRIGRNFVAGVRFKM
jgi:iron complex outermembrane receptor protein